METHLHHFNTSLVLLYQIKKRLGPNCKQWSAVLFLLTVQELGSFDQICDSQRRQSHNSALTLLLLMSLKGQYHAIFSKQWSVVLFLLTVQELGSFDQICDTQRRQSHNSPLTLLLLMSLKGQYHAIFSNTLKIEKILFG